MGSVVYSTLSAAGTPTALSSISFVGICIIKSALPAVLPFRSSVDENSCMVAFLIIPTRAVALISWAPKPACSAQCTRDSGR